MFKRPLSLRGACEYLPETVFRILFSLIFIVAGGGHVLNPAQIVGRLMKSPGAALVTQVAPAEVLVILTGIVLLTGGLFLLTGLWVRLSALALFAVLIPITLSVQVGAEGGVGPLFKNIALMGGLIFLAFGNKLRVHVSEPLFSEPIREAKSHGVMMGIPLRAVAAAVLALSIAFGGGMALGRSNGKSAPLLEQGVSAGAAFLVREPAHIKAALTTAQEVIEGASSFRARAASVVICGPSGVAVAMRGHEMVSLIREARNKGVDVTVCGLTLKEKGIDPALVSESVRIVENGMTEMMRLQSHGYVSVQL